MFIITIGLGKNTFARVHINLELSVNEKFVAYGSVVKVLATLRSPRAKTCYLIYAIEKLAIEKVYLPQCFGNNFFFIICQAEDTKALKNKCSIHNKYFLLRMGH